MAVAIDTAMPLSGFNDFGPGATMGVVDTDTRLGDDVLSRTFVKELEHYYDKADYADKARCLELITSVNLGEQLRQHVRRPKTAMPLTVEGPTSVLNPYQTTYNKEYIPRSNPDVKAWRPMTSQGFATTLPQSQPPGPTTYDVEFEKKFQRPASPERAGSSSGNRNNRPHPAKAFMVWKFPRKGRNSSADSPRWSEDLTNEKLNQINKRLMQSIYQQDYLGIPQGFQVKSAFRLPPDWKDNVQYAMDSNQRESYQQPFQQPELVLPVNRYGSNHKKPFAAVGLIPTANKRMIGVNSRTTYDRHYNDNAGPVVEQIRDVGRKLGADALKKYYQRNVGEDKDHVSKLMKEYGVTGATPTPPAMTRPFAPTPPASSRSVSAPVRSPTQRASRSSNRTPVSSSRLRPCVPEATPTLPVAPPMVPAPSPVIQAMSPKVDMPTTPPSAPYSPPMFLS